MKKKLLIFAMFIFGCILAELPSSVPGGASLVGQPQGVERMVTDQSDSPESIATIGMISGMR
jgi:hypothetical protein